MCRTGIAPAARGLLGQILSDMAQQLANQSGVSASEVIIGPVDFGDASEDPALPLDQRMADQP